MHRTSTFPTAYTPTRLSWPPRLIFRTKTTHSFKIRTALHSSGPDFIFSGSRVKKHIASFGLARVRSTYPATGETRSCKLLLSREGSLCSTTEKPLGSEGANDPGKCPQYHLPESGVLSRLPVPWVPYAELMRLDKPAGLYLFYFPYLFGTLYGACLAGPIVPVLSLATANATLLAGTIIMRGAACSWNDNIDRDYDRRVARCCLRPIARYAITPRQGHVFTGVQSLVGFGILTLLPMNCSYYAVPIIVVLGLYPFAKRFLNYPQVVLGFPVSWAIFMGMTAVNVDPHILVSDGNFGIAAGMACFYASNVAWTIIYDSIYAHQDVKDDQVAGVKSIAVHWRERTKALLSGLAIAQVAMLVATGAFSDLGPLYYITSCGCTAASLAVMIRRVDLSKPSDCMWWFKNGAWFVGGSITTGLLGDYLQRLNEDDVERETQSSGHNR